MNPRDVCRLRESLLGTFHNMKSFSGLLNHQSLIGMDVKSVRLTLNVSLVPNVVNFHPARFIGKVCRISLFLCKKPEDFKNSYCHCQKQLLHGQILIFCRKIRFKAPFDVFIVVFPDDNMHFQIPRHFLHKKSSKMQTLPMNRADLQ